MAKPQSSKLRLLVTLHTLFKYSDAKHRFNNKKLNEYLLPYNVDFKEHIVLKDTVRVMQEIGIDVRSSGYWGSYGVWIEDRPLSEDALKRLVFAISTNPHLSNAEATKILQSLTPLVTAYQESLLQSQVVTSRDDEQSQKLYKIYSVILEAISANKAVRCILAHTQNVRNSGDIQIQKANGTKFQKLLRILLIN